MARPEAKHFYFNWVPFNFRAVVSFQAVLKDRLAGQQASRACAQQLSGMNLKACVSSDQPEMTSDQETGTPLVVNPLAYVCLGPLRFSKCHEAPTIGGKCGADSQGWGVGQSE